MAADFHGHGRSPGAAEGCGRAVGAGWRAGGDIRSVSYRVPGPPRAPGGAAAVPPFRARRVGRPARAPAPASYLRAGIRAIKAGPPHPDKRRRYVHDPGWWMADRDLGEACAQKGVSRLRLGRKPGRLGACLEGVTPKPLRTAELVTSSKPACVYTKRIVNGRRLA